MPDDAVPAVCRPPKTKRARRRLAASGLAMGLLLAACGGSGDGPGPGPGGGGPQDVSASGVVQKGLFNALAVEAFLVDDQTGAISTSGTISAVADDQSFTVTAPPGTMVLLEATGEFAHELTGDPVTVDEPLLAIVNVVAADVSINVNIATHLSAVRTLAELDAQPQPVQPLIDANNDFVAEAFGFPVPTDPTRLDFSDISSSSDIDDPNLRLLLISAALVDSLLGGNLFADGFAALSDAFSGAAAVADLGDELAQLNGFGASALYTVIKSGGYSGNLPDIGITGNPVMDCSSGACGWLPQPSPIITIVGDAVYESYGESTVKVRLSEISATPLTVELTTVSGTAERVVDFGIGPGVVSIPAGRLSATAIVTLKIDAEVEDDERFSVLLETDSQDYAVPSDEAEVVIIDGAPDRFDGQDASDLRLVELCVKGVGALVGYPRQDCSAVLDPEIGVVPDRGDSAGVELDLAVECGSTQDCPPLGTDWLIEFYLVAVEGDVPQDENYLGSYVYNRNSLQLTGDAADPRDVLVALAGSAGSTFISTAMTNGWGLELEARFPGAMAAAGTAEVPTLIALPETMQAGGRSILIGEVDSIVPGDGAACPAGSYELTGGFIVGPGYEGDGTTAGGTVCIEVAVLPDGTLAGTMVGGEVGLAGTILSLAPGHVMLLGRLDSGPVSPRSAFDGALDGLLLLPDTPPSSDPDAGRLFLHAENLPFYFLVTGGTLTPDGIDIEYDGMRYVMDADYSPQDPRAAGAIASNDALYAGVAGHSGTFRLNADGTIDTTIDVAAGVARTAFPLADVEWQSFSQSIDDSEIADTAQTDLAFLMRQSTACASPDCAVGGELVYGAEITAAAIDARGYVVGAGTESDQVPVTPGWGADPAGELAFSRPDDLAQPTAGLTLALPGYRIPQGGDDRVVDYLLAHVEAGTLAGRHTVHPLGSPAANDGNHYPTGLVLGPQLYRDGGGAPATGTGQNLAGNAFAISDGTTLGDVGSSIATKYVVRNAGITGAFNSDPLSLQTPLEFRGYDMTFNRFAVRLVDNELDLYNWIDGSLTLYGDAGGPETGDGLQLAFSNLEMNCAARFGNANLVFEQCDATDNNDNGLIDENCGHRLSSWRADTEIYSMRFSDGQSCAAGKQLLRLQQQVLFGAVDAPVGLDADWDSDGTLVEASQRTQVPASYRLDRLDDGSKGFPVRPGPATLGVEEVATADNGRYGFASISDTLFAVPFWNAIEADVRLANRESIGQVVPEPTVVVPDLAAKPAAQSNGDLQQAIIDDDALDVTARYEWGNTGFGFQLPVFYSPESFNGDQPQFIGKRRSRDLFVLEAGAGINYIDPVRTKLSFGASADISKLKGVSFQVDLGNPESLGKVDDLLVSLNIVDSPVIEPTLGELNENLEIVNKLANKGIDETMQQGLEAALEQLGAAVPGGDPFELVSQQLAAIKSYPQEVLVILDEEVKARSDELLADLRAQLGFQLVLLESELVQLGQGDPVPAVFTDALDDTLAMLDKAETTAGQARDSIMQASDDVQVLVLQARAPLGSIDGALDELDSLLEEAVGFSAAACSQGAVPVNSAGYLGQLERRLGTVRTIFDLVAGGSVLAPLAELLVDDPELSDRIDQTLEDIRTQAEELETYLGDAEDALRALVCSDRTTELLADARAVVTRIRADVGQIDGFIDAAADAAEEAEDIAVLLEDELLGTLSQVRQAVAAFRDDLGNVASADGSVLLANLEAELNQLTGGTINKLAADPNDPNERDIVKAVFDPARLAVDSAYLVLRGELDTQMRSLLPGAYYSAAELRRMFVTTIMNSAPIADLRTNINEYLAEIDYRLNNLILLATDQLNTGLRAALSRVESAVNDALSAATAPVRNIPLESAKLDGFAVIAGNELERAHIGAEWTMAPSAEGESGNTFGAALDAVSWSASNKAAGCGVGGDDGRLDVTISAMGLPANFLSSDILLKKLYLGFTLGSAPGRLVPRGVFGGISTDGDIGFAEAIVYDPAFAAGIGDIETYIGASAGAVFSDIQAEVAFLVGRTCNADILTELDPRVGEFITLPDTGFGGVYARGGATIPLLTLSCPLTVGVGADFGAWVLAGPPATFGGLVGGSAYGKVACVGALRGQILAIGQVNTDGDLFFSGQGFGAAGLGFCEPETWTTKAKSREDGLCGTGDASFIATFDNGKWEIPKPSIGAIY